MGLFALSEGDSPEELVKAAIANLNLWQEWGQHDYLLDNFALGCVLGAMGLNVEQIDQVRKFIAELQGDTGV